jgi:predicted nucleic acid-binding protein
LLPFNVDAAERYARIRAKWKVSPADAIHLACASVARVDLYLSNDAGLKKLVIDGIHFIAGLDATIL